MTQSAGNTARSAVATASWCSRVGRAARSLRSCPSIAPHATGSRSLKGAESRAQIVIVGIVGRLGNDGARLALAENLDREFGADRRQLRPDVADRQTLANRVPVIT